MLGCLSCLCNHYESWSECLPRSFLHVGQVLYDTQMSDEGSSLPFVLLSTHCKIVAGYIYFMFLFAFIFLEKAYLQYSKIKPNLVDLEHTVVPEQHRGHGIGKVLAQVYIIDKKGLFIIKLHLSIIPPPLAPHPAPTTPLPQSQVAGVGMKEGLHHENIYIVNPIFIL